MFPTYVKKSLNIRTRKPVLKRCTFAIGSSPIWHYLHTWVMPYLRFSFAGNPRGPRTKLSPCVCVHFFFYITPYESPMSAPLQWAVLATLAIFFLFCGDWFVCSATSGIIRKKQTSNCNGVLFYAGGFNSQKFGEIISNFSSVVAFT